jgi:hypothetical protein
MLMLDRPEDNLRMTKERDLLPWILGALSATTLAVAVTAVATHKAVAPLPQPVPIVAAAATPLPVPLPGSELPSAPSPAVPAQAVAPAQAATPAQTPDQPEVQAGQIWECVTNGVKTFSNNPCGEKSSLLEVRSINTMNPTPPLHYARAYPAQAQYAPSYADAGTSLDDQEDYADQDGAESGANSYAIIQGAAFLPRRRPQHHPHRPPYHQRTTQPLHSTAPPARKF